MRILNLTQHTGTADQYEAGVIEPLEKDKVKTLLTFNQIPSIDNLVLSARALANIAEEENVVYCMIGGAPFFMSYLENALREKGITPLYAFSVRESVESVDSEGNVVKTNVFRHKGFVGL